MVPFTAAITPNPHHILIYFLVTESCKAFWTNLFVIFTSTSLDNALHFHSVESFRALGVNLKLVESVLHVLFRIQIDSVDIINNRNYVITSDDLILWLLDKVSHVYIHLFLYVISLLHKLHIAPVFLHIVSLDYLARVSNLPGSIHSLFIIGVYFRLLSEDKLSIPSSTHTLIHWYLHTIVGFHTHIIHSRC